MREPGGPEGRALPDVEPLHDHLEEVGHALDAAGRWSLLLDFDGTLAPIVDHPAWARVPEASAACLEELSRRPEGLVAIISGRSIADVRALLDNDALYYAGNHGLEIAGPDGMRFREPRAAALGAMLSRRGACLASRLATIPGALLQEKGLTTSVHYRQVDPAHWGTIARVVEEVVPTDDPDLVVHGGKRVHEIRPRVAWGKGHAAVWLLEQLGRHEDIVFFLGDDVTDEDAFRELSGRGVTVRVGAFQRTLARYRVADTAEVTAFLEWLARRA